MTLKEMKRKTLGLIEEYSPNSTVLTDDPDIATKMNDVINQVMFELVRIKKLAKFVDVPVAKGEVLTLEDIGSEVGYDVYQVDTISGVNYKRRANGTAFQFLDSGTAEIDCFVYPERITENTRDNYEFELSQDVLEIMPYGVAADLLKSDISTEYGTIYATRYESMKQLIDPRNNMTSIYIEGGVSF